jgi:hypothetical protein
MRIEIKPSGRGPSAAMTGILEALIGYVIELEAPGYYSAASDVYVDRVDPDGDVVVRELDARGVPEPNVWTAIPQEAIESIRVATGEDA